MDKILVLHPSEENIEEILIKANAQNDRIGPLSAVVLLGQRLPLFAPKVVPSAPTYFFSRTEDEGQFVDISQNLICVQAPANSPAYIRLPSKITLAFIDDSVKSEQETQESELVHADILFTYHWPSAIAAQQKLALVANRRLDPVVTKIQPRYHFSAGAGGRKFEAAPFSWTPSRSCRFISLAKEGSGEKWFFAFSISTAADEPKTGSNPFEVAKRKREESEHVPQKQARVHEISSHGGKSEARHVSPLECYFCLANPRLESHMIVSIGQHSYVTTAKGPLTRPISELGMAGHGIIIPIQHVSKILPSETELVQEMAGYKKALVAMFDANDFDVVFFDFNKTDNVHYHTQFIPVPRGVLGNEGTAFLSLLDEKVKYHNENFPRNTELNFSQDTNIGDSDCIRFSVFIDNKELRLVAKLDGPVDLQLPRRVMAILLGLPKRINWNRCKQSQHQETQECENFKKMFKSFDPSGDA